MSSSQNQSGWETSLATIDDISESARAQLKSANSLSDLDPIQVEFFSKKGKLAELMKLLPGLAPEARKDFGARVNALKTDLEAALGTTRADLLIAGQRAEEQREWIDVTLPVRAPLGFAGTGSLHPLTHVTRELEKIFLGLNFSVVDGPELELEWFNFDALNVPDTHPARDMQDTFWIKNPLESDHPSLLRTHTSSIQARTLCRLVAEGKQPPLRIVAPGRCFRYERIDASHEHTFYQMEGMMVDRHVTVGHLIYFMRTLLREIFGGEQKIRLRPGYFPFVEPGFELDIWFQDRWMELLPCGLIHPKVLENCGLDPKEWQGFAFGLGLSRLVMSRFEIDDIRHMMSGDVRFLHQFR